MTSLPCKPAPCVMIVDDSVANVRFLSHLLQDLGDVVFATNGQDALQLAREKEPDLMLLDVEMPGMDGYEVCRLMKDDKALAQCAVIFITGHTGAEYEIRALEAGAVDFIPKPFNPPVVKARAKSHLTLKLQSDILRSQASLDGLTGVFNRRMFDARLDEEVRRHRRYQVPMALAMVDVDRFKLYNDGYGHQAGDQCLKAVASALNGAARRPGEMTARYGGEEFALILPACDLDGARKLGEWLCQSVRALAMPHNGSPETGQVTISVGVASLVPQDDEAGQHLVAAADMGLYLAKSGGRNRVVAQPLPPAPRFN